MKSYPYDCKVKCEVINICNSGTAVKKHIPTILVIILFSTILLSCDDKKSVTRDSVSTKVVIEESFMTPWNRVDNIDSPAVWHGPEGTHVLIATAKDTDVLVVYDAGNGEELMRVGSSGSELNQFRRPNGIAVIDDGGVAAFSLKDIGDALNLNIE